MSFVVRRLSKQRHAHSKPSSVEMRASRCSKEHGLGSRTTCELSVIRQLAPGCGNGKLISNDELPTFGIIVPFCFALRLESLARTTFEKVN